MVLLSGGIDSATCLYLSREKGFSNRALTVVIHGMAKGEERAARRVAKAGGVEEHRFVSIPQLRELSDIKRAGRLAGLPRTYIPMKNATYYSLAAAYAEESGASRLVGGHNKDDMVRFEDTSDEFFESMQKTFRDGSSRLRKQQLVVWRPLSRLSKAQVVRLAESLGVPFELTWSCHRDGPEHCRRCEGCRSRARSFRDAGVRDPLMRTGTKNV